MKYLYFIFLAIIISGYGFSQQIISIYPYQVAQNTNSYIHIYGNKTHFQSTDSNLVLLINGSDTIIKNIVSIYSEVEIYDFTYFNFNNKGFYDLYVINSIDDTMMMKNAVFASKSYPSTRVLEYNHQSGINSSLSINSEYSHFLSSNDINVEFINNQNDTLLVDTIIAISEDSLYVSFITTMAQNGIYNMMLYTDVDSFTYLPNAIDIQNSDYIQIDSISPDTLNNWNPCEQTITVYGNNTHFTQDSNSVVLTGVNTFETSNLSVVNDSVLSFHVDIPIACKGPNPPPPWLITGFLYNPIDSFLGFSFHVFIAGSVNDHNISNRVDVFPNPVSNEMINLSFEKTLSVDTEVNIYDCNGKLLLQKQLLKGANQHIINLPDMEKGIYFYEIEGVGGGKFIVL